MHQRGFIVKRKKGKRDKSRRNREGACLGCVYCEKQGQCLGESERLKSLVCELLLQLSYSNCEKGKVESEGKK